MIQNPIQCSVANVEHSIFRVNNFDYVFEVGMTWEEYCNSAYNKKSNAISEPTILSTIERCYIKPAGQVEYGIYSWQYISLDGTMAGTVSKDDIIIPMRVYKLYYDD